MAKSIQRIISKLPKARRDKIRARTAELIALEMTIQQLRKNRKFTQEQIAEILGIGQDSISRLECRPDIKLSTLRNYINALGGELQLVAHFPNSEPVRIM